jgi:hypothetical protein
MLFDPKWETKADHLSLVNLIAWLDTQPPSRRYCYTKPDRCLLARWIQSTAPGRDHLIYPDEVAQMFGGRGVFVVLGEWVTARERTFGLALARARAVLADQEVVRDDLELARNKSGAA